jgi:hypothetical protein
MPRLPFAAATLLALVTLTARAAEPPAEPPAAAEAPPETAAPSEDEPSVVAEPPASVVPAPPAAPPAPARTAPAPAATVAVSAASAATPAPARRLKRERHGLALSLGLGVTYSLLGGQARYDIPVTRSLTVSPFVGAGIFGLLAGPVGVSTALGYRHRLVGDVAVAPLTWVILNLHGTRVEGSVVHGPTVGLGYEHMSDRGWFQHLTFNYSYAAWGATVPIGDPHVFFTSAGFGWRIW